MPKDPNEIGALWIKNAGEQNEFLSGKLGDMKIVAFRNRLKRPGESTPDYRILRPLPRPAPAAAPITDDDIPF